MKHIQAMRCTFETWLVRKEAILSEIPGTFTVEIRSVPEGKRYRLKALVIPTLQQFPQSFPESKLTEAMEYVNFQFKVQVGEWEEIA